MPAVESTISGLFELADLAGQALDAPVTIEDAQSRVLAYSLHGRADTARIATIIGRRVPEAVMAHFRSRGVYRHLIQSAAPIFVPPGPEGIAARLVLPIRAGAEWLGSVWVLVDEEPPAEVLAELEPVLARITMFLLRLRAEGDAARNAFRDEIRALLTGAAPAGPGSDLPEAPLRAVVLAGMTEPTQGPALEADIWDSVLRRVGWRTPVVADHDGSVVAIVGGDGPDDGDSSRTRPGTWAWLAHSVAELRHESPRIRVAAGGPADGPEQLPRSAAQAAELAALQRDELVPAVARFDRQWESVVTARALTAVAAVDGTPGTDGIGGPIEELLRIDQRDGSALVPTLTAYLLEYGRPRAAAAALTIHPNTLRYRLRQITAAVDLDLASPGERLALLLGCLAAVRAGRTRRRSAVEAMLRGREA